MCHKASHKQHMISISTSRQSEESAKKKQQHIMFYQSRVERRIMQNPNRTACMIRPTCNCVGMGVDCIGLTFAIGRFWSCDCDEGGKLDLKQKHGQS